MNIKYSFALELRDTGRHGFMLPVDQIKVGIYNQLVNTVGYDIIDIYIIMLSTICLHFQPTVEETWSGMTAMALEIAKEYTGNPNKATKITEVF